jgi:hypothetical protein
MICLQIGWARELLARLEALVDGEDAHATHYADLKENGWKWGLNTTLVSDPVCRVSSCSSALYICC